MMINTIDHKFVSKCYKIIKYSLFNGFYIENDFFYHL